MKKIINYIVILFIVLLSSTLINAFNREMFYDVNNIQKISFVTFGGPSNAYRSRVKDLTKQAKDLNVFYNIYGFTDLDLKRDQEFWNKHKDFVDSSSRGFGYWIWKPYLILKIFDEIDENDVVIYADAGCTLTDNINGLRKYVEKLNKSEYGVLSFTLTHPEKKYNKGDVFDYFSDFDQEELKNSMQSQATFFLVKKNKHSQEFMKKWYELSCNYHFIDETPSKIPNEPEFLEHRHDQSIFSILTKVYGSEKLENNEDFIVISRNRGNNDSKFDENTQLIYKNIKNNNLNN